MRRNWLTVLLFALALVVQTIAPAAANVVMAKAGGSIAAAELCASAGGDASDRQQGPGRLHHHRDACPLCQAYCDGVAPLVSRPLAAGQPPALWTALSWTTVNRAPPPPAADHARQARAPPSYS